MNILLLGCLVTCEQVRAGDKRTNYFSAIGLALHGMRRFCVNKLSTIIDLERITVHETTHKTD